jgi:hypothetical protein
MEPKEITMEKSSRTPYLFLLRRPSAAGRREAAERLRGLGLKVVAQYGEVAVEAHATPDQAEAAAESGMFAAQLRGAMTTENMQKLSEEQRLYVEQWNARFSAGFRRLKKDFSEAGKSWGEKERAEPLPYSAIGREDFLQLLERYKKETGERLRPESQTGASVKGKRARKRRPPPKPMTPRQFEAYERKLREKYKDDQLAYHLARLAYRLGPTYYTLILDLPLQVVAWILEYFLLEAACWVMSGEIAVGLVFVESSSSNGPRFGAAERNEICQEILDGQAWLADQHPTGNLSFVYDFQFVQIDVANGSGDPEEDYWRDPAMGEVSYHGASYTAGWAGVGEYREDMRQRNWSAHAMVIFVTPYANEWHAYASSGRVTLANRNNWGGWGRGTLDMITAHETSHLFGAADEYTGSGTPCSSCNTTHGCLNIPNGNCGACASPRQSCVMDGNARRLCAYTRGQIGWADLFVELTTADVLWAGTDDDVWLDIGDRTFVLDTADHDDRERNNREGYALSAPGLERADIKRILIRKSPDGFAGGWRLKRVRVWHAGALICDVDNINKWLEDDDRTWTGCVTDRNLINRLTVRISTADVMWAGTDDDVTIRLAGRTWNLDNAWHDDFERGNTDEFTLDPGTGLYLSDIHSVRIHKSPDGFAGGWKLKGVRVIANGSTIYNNQSINRWLEDDDRTWIDNF